ncbi:MAG: hypothetical protein AAFQ82_02740, partial [Myxococcota bacterium]
MVHSTGNSSTIRDRWVERLGAQPASDGEPAVKISGLDAAALARPPVYGRMPQGIATEFGPELDSQSDSALKRYLFTSLLGELSVYGKRAVQEALANNKTSRPELERALTNVLEKLKLLKGSPYSVYRVLLRTYHLSKADNWLNTPRSARDLDPIRGRHLELPVHGDATPSNLEVTVKDAKGRRQVEFLPHDYDEAVPNAPRSIDLERGAAAVHLMGICPEVKTGEVHTEVFWKAIKESALLRGGERVYRKRRS